MHVYKKKENFSFLSMSETDEQSRAQVQMHTSSKHDKGCHLVNKSCLCPNEAMLFHVYGKRSK